MPSLAHEKGEKDEDAQAGSTTAPHPISIKDRRGSTDKDPLGGSTDKDA